MANRKEAIKSFAVDLFHQKGYFATSISDISGRCGIQKASIYYHYASKEDLLFSIMQTTMDDLIAYLGANLEGIDSIEAKMRAAIHSHVRFHLERQKENFIANSELRGLTRDHRLDIVKKRDYYEREFQSLIQQGCQAGVFADCDVKIVSYAILTLCTAGAAWYKPRGRLAVSEIAATYENFVIGGLKQGTLSADPLRPE